MFNLWSTVKLLGKPLRYSFTMGETEPFQTIPNRGLTGGSFKKWLISKVMSLRYS